MNSTQLIELFEQMQQLEDALGGDGDNLRVYCRTCGGCVVAVTTETDEIGKRRINLICSEPGKVVKGQDVNELIELLEYSQRSWGSNLRAYCQNCESYVAGVTLEADENGNRRITFTVSE